MSKIEMFYREVVPCDDVAEIVFSFWEFAVNSEASETAIHEVFPDGCASLFYYRNQRTDESRLLISGSSLKTARIRVCGGDVYWGVRLSPAASLRFFDVDKLIPATQSLNLLPGWTQLSNDLIEQLNNCGDFTCAVLIFENFVRHRAVFVADARIAAAVHFIEENQAQVKVAQVAAAVKLSLRQFERRFRRASGITPKQYVRTRRIRATAVDLVENQNSNWANRAAEMGYTDQSHLTHEFTNVTGNSPVEFAEKVSRIEHGEIVR